MKKKLIALCALLCALCCFAGCSRTQNTDVFRLSHFNGVAEDGAMDSRYFYRNDFRLSGGDSQVIYVSEEQDETYGGYYYMYMSMCDGVTLETFAGDDPHRAAISVFRSKDLNDWERVGVVDNGYCVRFEMDEWPVAQAWAPETVYNPHDGKYYLYCSTEATSSPSWPVEYVTTGSGLNRFFLTICVSDTPVGPFKLLTSENYYGDANQPNLNGKVITKQNPPINIRYDLNSNQIFGTIDAHPWFDDVDSDGDGVNDFYLYFVRHRLNNDEGNQVWGMKMKDMLTPDYETLRCLTVPNYRTVELIEDSSLPLADTNRWKPIDEFVDADVYDALEDKTGKVSKEDYGEEYICNEGPFMYKDGGRYYLTYSPVGVGDIRYRVRQAISDSPLGMFDKLPLDPGTIMGADDNNTHMTGTGHHAFIEDNGELFCIHWPNMAPTGENVDAHGRAYAVDRIHFIEDETYGRILTGGPTNSLQAKPASYTGKVNVAPKAAITATNAVAGTEKYLNDEVVVFRPYFADKEFHANGKTTVTLSFSKPTEISAILIYNSYDYNFAFDGIDSILFYLSEKPAWFTGEKYVPVAGIFDLPFCRDYFENGHMNQGGAAVASFNDIKVNKIEITVSKKISDSNGDGIKISDIVVLGKGE